MNSGKRIFLIGVNFDRERGQIQDWKLSGRIVPAVSTVTGSDGHREVGHLTFGNWLQSV